MKLFFDEQNIVTLIYYPEDTPHELGEFSFLEVEELTPPQEQEGKVALLKANREKYWYEYIPQKNEENNQFKNLHAKLDALTESAELRDDLIQELALHIYQ